VSELHKVESRRTIVELCALFGKTKQAYYKRKEYSYKHAIKEDIVLQMVLRERKLMPRIGVRKLHYKLNNQSSNNTYIGRDALFTLLANNNLLVRKKRTRIITTNSFHWLHKYPNLIKDFIPTGPNQLWVSDITYIKTTEEVLYLFLITDAYSKKIMGWKLSDTLKAENAVLALQNALKQLPDGENTLIHHSDRGVQYCSISYVKLLEKNEISISMTQDGNPLDNAIAERVNGILKDEWLNLIELKTRHSARIYIGKIIDIYNSHRPHLSLGMKTPNHIHANDTKEMPKRLWKNYYKQYINNNLHETGI